jgi:hypothetical protein
VFLAVSLHEELKNTIKIFSKIRPENLKKISKKVRRLARPPFFFSQAPPWSGLFFSLDPLPPTHPGRVFLWVAFLGPPTLVAFFCGFTGLLPLVVAKKCNPANASVPQFHSAAAPRHAVALPKGTRGAPEAAKRTPGLPSPRALPGLKIPAVEI